MTRRKSRRDPTTRRKNLRVLQGEGKSHQVVMRTAWALLQYRHQLPAETATCALPTPSRPALRPCIASYDRRCLLQPCKYLVLLPPCTCSCLPARLNVCFWASAGACTVASSTVAPSAWQADNPKRHHVSVDMVPLCRQTTLRLTCAQERRTRMSRFVEIQFHLSAEKRKRRQGSWRPHMYSPYCHPTYL
jgi:hypothetical protein